MPNYKRRRLKSAHDPRERIHRRIQTHKWTEPAASTIMTIVIGGRQTQKRRAAHSCKEFVQRTKSERTKHRRITERRACKSASPAPYDRGDRPRARRSRRHRATHPRHGSTPEQPNHGKTDPKAKLKAKATRKSGTGARGKEKRRRSPVEHAHRALRVVVGREDDGAETPRASVGAQRDVRAQNRARLAEEVLEVLPLAVERELRTDAYGQRGTRIRGGGW